ncbi:unnamed protein product [Echinostoma caproni]|uniref:Ferritin domain-containing protein n=1 Tax=Echinostoma caproni TaxID=27848 RepID=A0A183AV87_9TREM|nr:unnamed protein product [Echinostoma caproni]
MVVFESASATCSPTLDVIDSFLSWEYSAVERLVGRFPTLCIATTSLELNDPFRLHLDLEVGFNNQILAEYEAFYVYEHMLNSETAPQKYNSIKDAIELAIAKEMHVSRLIQELHLRASQLNDPQAQHFLDDFLMEQVESTSKLRVIRSRLSLDSSAPFLLDKELR